MENYIINQDILKDLFVDGFVTDESDLTDEMYKNAAMHDENGAWQMIFGVNTLPEYRRQRVAAALLERAIADAKAFCEKNGIKVVEKNGTTTAEVQMAAEALVAAGVKAVFTPTDNTIMTAELSIYESFIEAGVQHYTGADSFALNGALVGYGVDYVQLGEATADMVSQLLCDGKTPADLPYQTFDNGIVTINTETAEALGLDLAALKEAFKPYCTEITEVTTAENFS